MGAMAAGDESLAQRARLEDLLTAPMRTSIVRGRVTTLDGRQPLSRVYIEVQSVGEPRSGASATTNGDGEYEVKDLPAGRYLITASKAGFLSLRYGQRRPREPGRVVVLQAAQAVENIDFALAPGGVVEGIVVDERGEPVANAAVEVWRERYREGFPELTSATRGSDNTDDRGHFRVYGIEPGTYLLTGVAARTMSMIDRFTGEETVTVFYPGTLTAAEAEPIQVGPAQEVSGVRLTIVRGRVASLRGVVRMSTGQVAAAVSVTLAQSPFVGDMKATTTARDGSYAFTNLSPGTYWLTARSGIRDPEVADASVSMDGADVSVPLTLRRGHALRGRIRFDPDAQAESLRPATVQLRAFADAPRDILVRTPVAQAHGDWTFEIPGLVGQRRLGVDLPDGWTVQSVLRAGTDITDSAIDFTGQDVNDVVITLTQRLTTVSGTVQDGDRQVRDATVLVFADDLQRWHPRSRFVRRAQLNDAGQYVVRGLPAGAYRAVALDYLEEGQESNPGTLQRLRLSGATFTLEDGGAHRMPLPLSHVQ